MIIESFVGGNPIERLAVAELHKYVHASGVVKDEGAEGKYLVPSLVREQWKRVRISLRLSDECPTTDVASQGFQWTITHDVGDFYRVGIVGNSSRGLLYGVYIFIERYLGFQFTMTGEERRTLVPLPEKEHIAERPLVALRGTLPWHNFLGGPTGWNRRDYFGYVDRLAKMRCNLITFHVYTGGIERYWTYVEPFIKVQWQGIEPMAEWDTTKTARWGYVPRKTIDFLGGTDSFFETEHFGSDLAIDSREVADQYHRARKLLRDLIDFAHERGIHVGLGFEPGIVPPEVHSLIPGDARLPNLVLDPFHPVSQEILANTICYISDSYPRLDYLVLWQHEHAGIMHHLPRPDTAFAEYCDQHKSVFANLPCDRQFDGCWALAMFEQATNLCRELLPQTKVVLSGWGGDEQFPSLLSGLNRKLPKDIAFCCLAPNLGEKEGPQELLQIKDRNVWLLPWFEGDHQFWHPQPRIHVLDKQIGSGLAANVQGLLGIHWRICEIEDQFVYFAQRLWDDTMTPTDFYVRYWQEPNQDVISDSLLDSLVAMDRDFWFKGASSPEYFGYTSRWGWLTPKQYQEIGELIQRLSKIKAVRTSARIDQLFHMLQLSLLLHQLAEGYARVEQMKEKLLNQSPSQGKMQRICHEALDILDHLPLEEAIMTYAQKIGRRGTGPEYRSELGVLCSLNQRLASYHESLVEFFQG